MSLCVNTAAISSASVASESARSRSPSAATNVTTNTVNHVNDQHTLNATSAHPHHASTKSIPINQDKIVTKVLISTCD